MSAGWLAAAVVLFVASGLLAIAVLPALASAVHGNVEDDEIPALLGLLGSAVFVGLLGAVCLGVAS